MTQSTATSLAEFYVDPTSPYAAFQRESRSGGSMPVKMMRVAQEAHTFTDPAVDEIVLAMGVTADMLFRWDVGDGLTTEQYYRSGSFCLAPSQTSIEYDCRSDHEVLFFMFPLGPLSQLLDEAANARLSDFDPLTGTTLFQDNALRRTMMQMWAESARSGGTSDLLMDGLMQLLLARLLEKAGAMRRPQLAPALGEVELSRIDAFVDSRLAERITVEDLARALDMPRWTFADAFKATTGDTPHAYVTTKRVDRACHLLRLGDMPLAEIAYATGFASQSHMTDTFRRVIGTTPGAYRQEVRS